MTLASHDSNSQRAASDSISLLLPAAPCYSLRLLATRCYSLQLPAAPCYPLQLPATPCYSLKLSATPCSSLLLPATPCVSPQLPATPCRSLLLPATPRSSKQIRYEINSIISEKNSNINILKDLSKQKHFVQRSCRVLHKKFVPPMVAFSFRLHSQLFSVHRDYTH